MAEALTALVWHLVFILLFMAHPGDPHSMGQRTSVLLGLHVDLRRWGSLSFTWWALLHLQSTSVTGGAEPMSWGPDPCGLGSCQEGARLSPWEPGSHEPLLCCAFS